MQRRLPWTQRSWMTWEQTPWTFFQIIMGIEEEFDIEISNEDAEKIVSVGDAVEEIKNALN